MNVRSQSVYRGSLAARLMALLIPLVFSLTRVDGHDWPQFLGPKRNGADDEESIAKSFPREGPSRLWQRKVGQGFSSPIVISNRVVICDRVDSDELVECLDANTGKTVWTLKSPTTYQDDFGFDEGPRATPAFADGRIFTMSAEGLIQSIDFSTGKKFWSVATKKEYGARKGYFGMACSPLVENGTVIVNIGGESGAGTVALEAATGKLRWKATDDEASYSSPIAATFDSQRYILVFSRSGLLGLEPESGKLKFEFPWRARNSASVNAATPLVIGNKIFLSASYQTGAALLEIVEANPKKIWSADDVLSNHYSTSVYHDGFVYGFDGRQEQGQSFVCLELATGKNKWREERFGAGTVIISGDQLVVLTEKGELILAPASAKEFKPTARAQILGSGVRSYPALANGLLYARDKQNLACFDLRKQ
ncbi:MAG: Pyrrolo-quinoline quinone [Verrucomicrobiales bacterium]|nr:Pyrrolo-quinoline quinone [Verrucomicrobiales bacterium]